MFHKLVGRLCFSIESGGDMWWPQKCNFKNASARLHAQSIFFPRWCSCLCRWRAPSCWQNQAGDFKRCAKLHTTVEIERRSLDPLTSLLIAGTSTSLRSCDFDGAAICLKNRAPRTIKIEGCIANLVWLQYVRWNVGQKSPLRTPKTASKCAPCTMWSSCVKFCILMICGSIGVKIVLTHVHSNTHTQSHPHVAACHDFEILWDKAKKIRWLCQPL